MVDYIIYAFLIFMGAFAYRIRGGGWFTFNSDTICRSIWGLFGLNIPFSCLMLVQAAPFDCAHISYAILLVPLAFVAMFIPHAFAQNTGTLNRPWTIGPNGETEPWSKYWPGIWLPYPETQAEYDGCLTVFRTLFDFFGMASSAFFQGAAIFGLPLLIVFGLRHYFSIYLEVANVSFLRAWFIITAGCPVAYLIGRFLPTLSQSLSNGACWGEFITGGVWVLALLEL